MTLAAIEIRRVVGAEIAPYLGDLASLRIELFAEYPYLYDGDRAYEETYLRSYVEAEQSVALLALDDGRVVGASTGAPLADEPDETRAPFVARGEDLARVFYCGESLVRPAFRGRGLYRRFLSGRETFARERGFAYCAFCAVDRPPDHPAKPHDYVPLDAVWTAFGYERRPELVASYAWRDLGGARETKKPMVFWTKALA